jgi:hypothetical protein
MKHAFNRRCFVKSALSGGALAATGNFDFLSGLGNVSAAEAALEPKRVQLHPEIEPLVRLLETTPRNRVLEEVASRVQRGLTYREVVAALQLAGVRNIQPRPVGFKFHAVLVVNSAHLASVSSPDSDRWLPIFWAIDQFKSSQAADERAGDWTLGPLDESAVPSGHKARQAFIEAMDNWDEPAADVAIARLARTTGAHDLFEILARYGSRDFRDLGHKAIYVANSFRTLELIGWQHAEPILRSLAFALLDRGNEKQNPAKADLPADRPFRANLENVKRIRRDWLDGKRSADASKEILQLVRRASAIEISEKAVEILNKGIAPQSIFDGLCEAAGELLVRAPDIRSLHAFTCTNAIHYAFQHARDEELRRVLLLQNCAFLPLFRGTKPDQGQRLDELEPLSAESEGSERLTDIFADVSKNRLNAARKTLAYLEGGGDPRLFSDAARRLIFLKGTDSHDYKFSSAALEDYQFMPRPIANRYLAASVFNLKGSGAKDSDLVRRTREALKS